jgi:glycosidase
MPDRFSDGRENERPLFDRDNPNAFTAPDLSAWRQAGKVFQGGTLQGITSKLDYLHGLGVTALWVGPIWRQRPDLQTYHGYGIQNFLDVDPRFGTRQDLRDLVDAAHDRGMYVLLDVVLNHSGNNWFYNDNSSSATTQPYRYAPPYPFGGWRSSQGSPAAAIASVDDGVWPVEFQNLDWYTRAGEISSWDPFPGEDPLDPNAEFRRGDFFDLKDINHDAPGALSGLIQAFQYWIAASDCDGFRIDTVKHISWEAARNFCGAIREYAETIGKDNFWLLAEVTGGGDMARDYLDIFGRNIDAVLDIGGPAVNLAGMVKGLSSASDFFNQFTGHDILGGHRETGRYHVSILDDHDMVGRPGKLRFAARNPIPNLHDQVAHAVATQLTTLGTPCIYYGTEQAFDGDEANGDAQNDPGFEDRYIREGMFDAPFGAFRTSGAHFFDPTHPAYQRIAAITRLRNQAGTVGLALRRGRQYPRQTAFLGLPFAVYGPGELVALSRLLFQQEVLVALNTHGAAPRGAEVTVDASLHTPGSTMTVLYHSSWDPATLTDPPANQTVTVQRQNDGRLTVQVDLPPAGMAILG